MAIKLKGWTSRLAVKICCIILVPVMAFIFCCEILRMAQLDEPYLIDIDMLMTDFTNNDFFYDTQVNSALHEVITVFSLKNEDHIRDMGCLQWQPSESYSYAYSYEGAYEEPYPDTIESLDYAESDVASSQAEYPYTAVVVEDSDQWMELSTVFYGKVYENWGGVPGQNIESPAAMQLLNGAINNQISSFYSTKKWLEEQKGLYYYITDGSRTLTNALGKDAEFFLSHEVYSINENGREIERSRSGSSGRYHYYANVPSSLTAYIAFDKSAVDAQTVKWSAVQQKVISQLGIMLVAVVIAAVATVILLTGTGRRYRQTDTKVHFISLDKPWLDFGFAVLVIYEVIICAGSVYLIETAWQYGNYRTIMLVFALLSVAFTLPLLNWLCSFTKRVKDGAWWNHTLVFSIIGYIKRLILSLWAGFPLTGKIILISLILLASMILTAMLPPLAILFTAGITFVLLRYGRKLHQLDVAAASVADGTAGEQPIDVRGGELGSIAASINSISDNINDEVGRRMRSERLRTELITNVSHDIRTPLTSLITYTDLLKTDGLDSEKAPEYLDILIQKSGRLKILTDDLFEAAKAASGNIEVSLEQLDIADFVKQVLGELDERVNQSQLDFRLNLPEHAVVSADGRLMWRVMDNLLSNVFKYALPMSRVYIDVSQDQNDVRIDVKNISRSELNIDPSELMERFKRGDSSRSDEGSGLGLSIAQSFVQAQGGQLEITVDGDLFKVSIYLPCN